MKYFQYFDLPKWQLVSQKLRDYVNDNTEFFSSKHNNASRLCNLNDMLTTIPEFTEMLAPLNVTVRRIGFYVLYKQTDDSWIHVDGGVHAARIILPVLNCDNTETRYYISDSPLIELRQPDGQPYLVLDKESKYTQVATLSVTRPAIHRVHEPHGVFLPQNAVFPRITCCIGVHEDLTHLLK